MTIFFTSDTHFGHENIIKYCDRPYASAAEMDADLIARWNGVVESDDLVYHLGDFTLGGKHHARDYFRRLNGRILVLGTAWHHDRNWLRNWHLEASADVVSELGPANMWTKSHHEVRIIPPLHVMELYKLGDGTHPLAITLCHYPLAVWDRKHYGAWHLHGHEHKRNRLAIPDGPIYNVGVDENNYTPVSLDQIVEQMTELGWMKSK